MSKILEIIGFVLVGIMILSFVGIIDPKNAGLTPLFWGCAGGTLLIIIYRKRKRDQAR
jgi:hypothetical protein